MQNCNDSVQPHSYFARRLATEPELVARCAVIADSVRAATHDDIVAGRQSEQLTATDLRTIINTRPYTKE